MSGGGGGSGGVSGGGGGSGGRRLGEGCGVAFSHPPTPHPGKRKYSNIQSTITEIYGRLLDH